MGPDMMIFVFWMLSFKPPFPLSSFTFNKGLFGSSLLSAIRVVSSVYLRLLIFLPAILIPACDSLTPAFHMMYPAYRLNKKIDNIQTWCTPFTIWNQSIVPCPGLSVASWSLYRFFRRQVRWCGIPISWRIFHSLLWSTQSKALALSVKKKMMFFWKSLAFSMIQRMLTIWSLVPFHLLNPAWALGALSSHTVETYVGEFWENNFSWFNLWSILKNVLSVLEKNVYFVSGWTFFTSLLNLVCVLHQVLDCFTSLFVLSII